MSLFDNSHRHCCCGRSVTDTGARCTKPRMGFKPNAVTLDEIHLDPRRLGPAMMHDIPLQCISFETDILVPRVILLWRKHTMRGVLEKCQLL